MNAIVEFPMHATTRHLRDVTVDFDETTNTMFWWMQPSNRPCFGVAFLEQAADFEGRIEAHQGWIDHAGRQVRIEHAVFGSRSPGVFNLGGDLGMFVQAILRKDRDTLSHYGRLCVRNMYRRIVGYNADVQTYSLVQGKAFGGGFECALASDVVIAEKQATFSFPEVLFNMFPGMGALSLLARRVGMRKAEDLIMSGQVFSAQQMKDEGIVDEIAEEGVGLETTRALIKARMKRKNTYRGMTLAKRQVQPVALEELLNVVDTWVDCALRLENRDLRMMARLAKAQDKLAPRADALDLESSDPLESCLRAVAA